MCENNNKVMVEVRADGHLVYDSVVSDLLFDVTSF